MFIVGFGSVGRGLLGKHGGNHSAGTTDILTHHAVTRIYQSLFNFNMRNRNI